MKMTSRGGTLAIVSNKAVSNKQRVNNPNRIISPAKYKLILEITKYFTTDPKKKNL